MFSFQHILVIDDHPLFVSGLRHYLANLAPQVSVQEAHTAAEARAQLQGGACPDCIFLDLQLPDLQGLHFLEDLRQLVPAVPVLIVSARQEPAWVYNALQRGAAGFLSKSSPELELREALTALEKGGRYVSSHLRRALDDYSAGMGASQHGAIRLTRRQQSVLALIDQGLNNRQISEQLHISESTVKGHVSTLFDLFNVENRTSCLREAKNYGLL